MPATSQPFGNFSITGSGNQITASYTEPSDWSDSVSNGEAEWANHGSYTNSTSSLAAPTSGKWTTKNSGTYFFYASNLPDGETISFRVRHQRKNQIDSSYVSGTYTTPAAPNPPNAPNQPTITDVQDTQMSFSWNSVATATSYKVYGGTQASPTLNGNLLSTQNATAYTWTSRTANQQYYVAVIAVNANGDSSPSSDRAIKTMVVDPSAPTAAQSTPVQNTITWSLVTGATITEIYGGTSSNPTNELHTNTNSGTSYTHTGLTPGTTYYYRIKQSNQNGHASGYSAQDSVATVTLAAPTNISGTPSATDNTVTFTEAAHSTRTYIYWSSTSGGTYNNAYVGSNQAYLTTPTATFNVDDGLESSNGTALLTGDNDVEYIKLKSFLSPHYSGYSSEYAAYSLPGTPTNLAAAQGSGEGEIDLSWTQTVGAGALTVTYSIERATSSGGTFTSAASNIASGTTTYTDTGLDGSTTYYYRIYATTSAGSSAVSSEANAATQASSGPDPSNEVLEMGKLNVLIGRGNDGDEVSMNDITGDTNEASLQDFYVGGFTSITPTSSQIVNSGFVLITANFENAGDRFKTKIDSGRFAYSITTGGGLASLGSANGRTIRLTKGTGQGTVTVSCTWTPIYNDHLSATTRTCNVQMITHGGA